MLAFAFFIKRSVDHASVPAGLGQGLLLHHDAAGDRRTVGYAGAEHPDLSLCPSPALAGSQPKAAGGEHSASSRSICERRASGPQAARRAAGRAPRAACQSRGPASACPPPPPRPLPAPVTAACAGSGVHRCAVLGSAPGIAAEDMAQPHVAPAAGQDGAGGPQSHCDPYRVGWTPPSCRSHGGTQHWQPVTLVSCVMQT